MQKINILLKKFFSAHPTWKYVCLINVCKNHKTNKTKQKLTTLYSVVKHEKHLS